MGERAGVSTRGMAPTSASRTLRRTSHLLLETESDYVLVSSLACRGDTVITRIDGRTGHPLHNGREGEDIFPNEEQALKFLLQEKSMRCQSKQRFPALLGMTRTNGKAHLLIAQRVRHDVHLFGGHMINTLVHTSWIEIPLSFPFPEVKEATKNEKLLHEFPLDGMHFYCDTYDITRPFPSSHAVTDHHRDFCWNDYLAAPFEEIGLRNVCVVLLQGSAQSRRFRTTKRDVTNLRPAPKATAKSEPTLGVHGGECGGGGSAGGRAAPPPSPAPSLAGEVGPPAPASLVSPPSAVSKVSEQIVGHVTSGGGTPQGKRGSAVSADTPEIVRASSVDLGREKGEREKEKRCEGNCGDEPCSCGGIGDSGGDGKKEDVTLCLITRKVKLNAGTRYTARGLNKMSSPGNECECEVIMLFRSKKEDARTARRVEKFTWLSYVWRRGTVPLWWKTTLNSKVGQPDIFIRPEQPYQGCEIYYARLLERYGPNPMFLFNLLRTDSKSKEGNLSDNFRKSIEYSKQLISMDLELIDFDWHGNTRQKGVETAIAGLWALMEQPLAKTGFSSGFIELEEVDVPLAPWLEGWQNCAPSGKFALHTCKERQTGVVRINCADSLDRTNCAGFFMCFQIVAEMGRRVGAGFERSYLPKLAKLPPWSFFKCTLTQLTHALSSAFITAIAEFFVSAGDVVSMLYTNSPAMHSAIIRDFSAKVASAPLNAFVAIKRRYQNVMNDKLRQAQYEMLLGLNREQYFPSTMALGSRRCLSQPSTTWIARKLSPLAPCDSQLLLRECEWLCWANELGQDFCEIVLFLPEPALVTDVAITVLRGACADAYPKFFDLSLGHYLDTCQPVWQNRPIPRCSSGTRLFYRVDALYRQPVERSSSMLKPSTPPLFPFRQRFARPDATRVVKIRLHGSPPASSFPSGVCLLLGKVEVFGEVAPSIQEVSPLEAVAEIRQRRLDAAVEELIGNMELASEEEENKAAEDSASKATHTKERRPSGIGRRVTSERDLFDSTGRRQSFPVAPLEDPTSDYEVEPLILSDDDLQELAHQHDSITDFSQSALLAAAKEAADSEAAAKRAAREAGENKKNDKKERVAKDPSRMVSIPEKGEPVQSFGHETGTAVGEDEGSPEDNRETSTNLMDTTAPEVSMDDTRASEAEKKFPPRGDNSLGGRVGQLKGCESKGGVILTPIRQRHGGKYGSSNNLKANDVNTDSPSSSLGSGEEHPSPGEKGPLKLLQFDSFHSLSAQALPASGEPLRLSRGASTTGKVDLSGLIDDYEGSIIHGRRTEDNSPRHRSLSLIRPQQEAVVKIVAEAEPAPISRKDSKNGPASKAKGMDEAVEEYRQQVQSKLVKVNSGLDEVEGSTRNKLGLLALLQLEYVRISHGISRRARDSVAEELSLPVHLLDPSRTVYYHNESLEAARRSIAKGKSSICGKCGQSLRFTRSSQCFYCRKRLCMSHLHPNQVKILEFRWNTPHNVCVDCHDVVRLQRQLLRRIRDRVADSPDSPDHWGNVAVSSLMESLQSAKFADNALPLCAHPSGVRSIATFPSAGLLHSVPTADASPPAEVLLMPEELVGTAGHWFSRPGVRQVRLSVVLGAQSRVLEVVVTSGDDPFTAEEMPLVTFAAGSTEEDLWEVGSWELSTAKVQSNGGGGQRFSFEMEEPLHCRLLDITVALPVSAPPDACLRLGRIRVYGTCAYSPIKLPQYSPSELEKYQEMLKRQPAFTRTIIKSIAGRTEQKSVELRIASGGAAVAGFTMTVKHGEVGDRSQCRLLHVRGLTMVAEKQQKESMIDVSEIQTFVVPMCKAGTQLSFDFSRLYSHNVFVFQFLLSYGGDMCPPKINGVYSKQ